MRIADCAVIDDANEQVQIVDNVNGQTFYARISPNNNGILKVTGAGPFTHEGLPADDGRPCLCPFCFPLQKQEKEQQQPSSGQSGSQKPKEPTGSEESRRGIPSNARCEVDYDNDISEEERTNDGAGEQKGYPSEMNRDAYLKILAMLRSRRSYFVNRLKSILRDNKFDRRTPGRKRGKLDNANLWRAMVGSEAVFRHKDARKNKNYHVALALDLSGSMTAVNMSNDDYSKPGRALEHMRSDYEYHVNHEANKIPPAAAATYFIAECLEELGITSELILYGEGVSVVKNHGQYLQSDRAFWRNIERSKVLQGGTPTGEAMAYAYEHLNKLDGEKMLFVLTDGSPDNPGYVDELERKYGDHIHTLGIGIMDRAVQNTHHHHVVAETMEDLVPLMTNHLQRNIRRG